MIFYHVTKSEFDFPDFEKILDILIDPESNKNPKGALGLWMSTRLKSCTSFGSCVAEIHLKDDFKPAFLEYEVLRSNYDHAHCDERSAANAPQLFHDLGRALGEHADVLFINDSLPIAGEVIIINTDCIDKIIWHHDFDFSRTDIKEYLMRNIQVDQDIQKRIEKITIENGEVKDSFNRILHP